MAGPISHHNPGEEDENTAPEAPPEEASADQKAQMEQAYAQMRRKLRMTRLAEDIGHKIMVLSGKGGVGKSTVATGLALSLAKQGKKVGILDIDITGPNIPKMLGIEETELHVEDNQIHPADGPNGLKVMSMAFLLEDPDKPIIWRGPIKLGAIQQFIGDVAWGKLDSLIIDFPPGTSDEPLTVAQYLPNIDGMVIVTTPQDVALLDSRKSINFSKTVKIPVLGVVENMSGLQLEGMVKTAGGIAQKNLRMVFQGIDQEVNTDEEGNFSFPIDLFKSGGGAEESERLGVPLLGKIPISMEVMSATDRGKPIILSNPQSTVSEIFRDITENIISQLVN